MSTQGVGLLIRNTYLPVSTFVGLELDDCESWQLLFDL